MRCLGRREETETDFFFFKVKSIVTIQNIFLVSLVVDILIILFLYHLNFKLTYENLFLCKHTLAEAFLIIQHNVQPVFHQIVSV